MRASKLLSPSSVPVASISVAVAAVALISSAVMTVPFDAVHLLVYSFGMSFRSMQFSCPAGAVPR